MNGSKEVIAALQDALDLSVEAYCWMHDEEHLWECEGFDELEKWFDGLDRAVWRKIHHKLLKRLYKLGGRPPGVLEDPEEALAKALSLLQGLHDACKVIYAAAGDDDDYVTEDKLDAIQGEIERRMVSAEKRLAQIARLRPSDPRTPWMAEQL